MPSPLLESSRLLLRLHERCHDVPLAAFQREALELAGQLVPCDAALLATGTLQDGTPVAHDIFVIGRPAEFMKTWERVRHEDPVSRISMQNPERSHAFEIAGPLFDDCHAVRAHCAEYRIAHILCTATFDATSGVYRVMSLCRERHDAPFDEEERATTEWLAPHVFASERRARLHELLDRARGTDRTDRAAAFVHASGLVLESEPHFFELLGIELPETRGPWLPPSLWTQLRSSEAPLRLSRVGLSCRPLGGELFVLDVRRLVAADQLTERERDVAARFSSGLTHREIGVHLGVSPHTVRRHLANVYEKLGISSKAELGRMLRD